MSAAKLITDAEAIDAAVAVLDASEIKVVFDHKAWAKVLAAMRVVDAWRAQREQGSKK